ncbi:BTB/POZ fold domain containing protein [Cordyceps fumosorosea ARSEF 2679]|uniref:BTB/POZ fold domain containing protein n=1 Tax=Cordyceps fumosorosea (strain ARSEF 2679) TaxID=1081104 RepID=A0A167S6R8_CORFA|nr:BTB/POZ fold domain containing protein [Cordyceps fumosorosea ARSEF 2679]OAA59314.1 BTB/POZ fold domain containing protein [Cordyceps fumosorosea ARSEF 2679]
MKEPSFATDGLSSQAAASVLRSLQERKYCDFDLVCQGHSIPVHKAVVCAQSRVFANICSRRSQRAAPISYGIPHSDIQTVELMVQYLYTGKHTYSVRGPIVSHDPSLPISETRMIDNPKYIRNKAAIVTVLSAHIKLLDLAETCLVDELVVRVVDEFRAVLSHPDYGYCFMALLEIIPSVYEQQNSARSLLRKECVAATTAGFGPWLTAHGSHRQALDKLLVTVPEFSKDLIDSFITTKQHPVKKQDSMSKSEMMRQ